MWDTDPPEKRTKTQTSRTRNSNAEAQSTATSSANKSTGKQATRGDKQTKKKRDHRTKGYVSVSSHRKAANELCLTLMHLNHSRERELIGALTRDHARV